MIVPFSIPTWIQVKQNAKRKGLEITVNVDPSKGRHTGHFFYNGKSYSFRLEMYPKNMVLSMKEFNRDLFDAWAEALEGKYRILYQTHTEFPFHAEWYYEVEEELIVQEITRMKNSHNIRVFYAE